MTLSFLIPSGGAILAASLAFIVGFTARRSRTHWFFVIGMLLFAAESMAVAQIGESILSEQLSWLRVAMFIQAFLPAVWLAFSLTYGRGEPTRQLSDWRFALVALFVLPVALVVLASGHLLSLQPSEGKTDVLLLRLGQSGRFLNIIFLLGCVLILMNLERTYRAAVGTMRWRIKFMILGLGVLFVVRAYTASQVLVFGSIDFGLQILNSGALVIACLTVLRSVFRVGNFDVGVYPSQSVLTNSFTVILAGLYLVVVGVFANAVTVFGGKTGFALKAFIALVAIVLLAVVLLSDRVRLHAKRFISRNFQRPLYDYRTVWQTVTDRTARCTRAPDLCEATAKLCSEIFEALSVSVWLLDENRERLQFGASTATTAAGASQLTPTPDESRDIMAALQAHPDPVDLDSCSQPWAAALRRAHPGEFRTGGSRLCLPMIAAGEMVGLMVLGDRVGGISFSLQDFDLLKSIASQAAAGLLNLQLGQKLSQSRQLEAFQAMSAFFVHDLKNTASTLSLMLQNLPVHYQDPQFREDALRGISRTVAHINDLISRLNMLRHELAIQPVECDLNSLVTEHLRDFALGEIELQQDFQPVPKLRLDPAQIQKVLTNLLLNARDAVGASGRIRVQTGRRDGWAVLSITDNGCGMSPEFIQQKLFRPFHTTKPNGIGIGMFHCKAIVEAHHGRIELKSEPDAGTTFHVLLPISPTLDGRS